jgi:hypothetical protein
MPLSEQQTRLAVTIDTHVKPVLAGGGSEKALRLSMADDMPTFKQPLDTGTGVDMDALCERYEG